MCRPFRCVTCPIETGAAPDNINRNSSRVKIGCTIAAPPLGQKLRAEDMSTRQVAGALNEMGHRTQRGTPWSALTVSASLNRESLNCAPAKWWSGFSASRRRRLAQTDPRSRPILRLILAQRDEGNLYLTIAENLNAEGYRAPCGFPWNVASISNIMSRRGVNHRTAAENA